MEQKTEALYLINGDKFLHLRENGAGVGFATYNCVTGAPQEFGQISKQNLPPDGRNAIPAARNWYLFELSDDARKAIQEVSLQHLDTIPQSGVRRRRIWDDPSIPRDDVRLINSHYDDFYRVPNHGVIRLCGTMAELDLRDSLHKMSCPVLVACGEKDNANKKASKELATVLQEFYDTIE